MRVPRLKPFDREKKISLLFALGAILLALPFIIAMWPSGDPIPEYERVDGHSHDQDGVLMQHDYERAEVVEVDTSMCEFWVDEHVYCGRGTVLIDGEQEHLNIGRDGWAAEVEPGDEIIVQQAYNPERDTTSHNFYSEPRAWGLISITVLAVFIVSTLVGGRGARAMGSLLVSGTFISIFLVPGILAGGNPIAYTVVSIVPLLALIMYSTHGINMKTTSAFIGTFIGALVAIFVGWLFSQLIGLTGLSSNNDHMAFMLYGIDLSLVAMAGLIIIMIGVLNDVTVAQASTVWSHESNDPRILLKKGLEVGQDHASSAIYTVAFSVIGGSLALMITSQAASVPLGTLLQSEDMATVVVQSLAGIIGLAATMPITTYIASKVKGRYVSS